jgi:hypothetical protein
MSHTYTTDVKIVVKFAEEKRFGCESYDRYCELVHAIVRLNNAIRDDLDDYSIPEEGIIERAKK